MSAAAAEVAVATSAVAVKGQCDKQTTLNVTREIKRSVEQSWRLLQEALERGAWAALDYDSWESYCTKELGTDLVRLSKELRREAVAELLIGDQPMSNCAIGAALGMSESTVCADRAAGARNRAPDLEPEVAEAEVPVEAEAVDPEVVDAEVVKTQILTEAESRGACAEEIQLLEECRVTGADGKTYAMKPEAKRRRPPLPDAFLKAARKVDKAAQSLVRLTEDDRFRTHAADLGGRGDVQRAADAIRKVIDAGPRLRTSND